MRKLVSYIMENSNQLLFFLLLGFSFLITLQHHSYYRSKVVGSVNNVNGSIAQSIYDMERYWALAEENEMLVRDNLLLKEQVYNSSKGNVYPNEVRSEEGELYCVYSCEVIRNSFNSYKNFLLLNIGASSGVQPDMGVFNSKGIIGVVEKVSDNYASASSVLHNKTEINAIIKGTHHFGTLRWDGKDYRFMQLIDVPGVANIKVGDKVVTGGMSAIFPSNIPIGVIDKLIKEDNSNYYQIQVKLYNDMTNLGHAYVIYNSHREEILELEKASEE